MVELTKKSSNIGTVTIVFVMILIVLLEIFSLSHVLYVDARPKMSSAGAENFQ